MEEELAKLRHRRGMLKAKVTRFTSFLGKKAAKTERDLLEAKYRVIQGILEQYEEIQDEIENLQQEKESIAREEFEESYLSALDGGKRMLDKFRTSSKKKRVDQPMIEEQDNNEATEARNSESEDNSEEQESSDVNEQERSEDHASSKSEATRSHRFQNSSNSVKLPEIKLPIFDGNYDEWLSFRESFISMIDTKGDLPNSMKFLYLKGCLQGQAKQVLKSMDTSEKSYELAWSLLKQRYEVKKLIMKKHLKAICKAEKIEQENGFAIRQLIDEVESNVRSLKALSIPVHHWDAILIYIVTDKLDEVTSREWELAIKQGYHKGLSHV